MKSSHIARAIIASGVALSLAGCAAMGEAPQTAPAGIVEEAAETQRDTVHNDAFRTIGSTFIEAIAEADPVFGTQIGLHQHDAQLTDLSPAGRQAQAAVLNGILMALGRVEFDRLTRQNQVDYRLLENDVRYQLWQLNTAREWEWNPQYYHNYASYGLYGLIARDYAPWPERFAALVSRMEQVPALLAQARAQIDPAKVPPVHARVTAQQTAGILSLVDDALLDLDEAGAAQRSRYDRALAGLQAAVKEHQAWLEGPIAAQAKGDFRLGAELYDQKMRFAMVTDLDRPALEKDALAAFDDVRSEMATIAREETECGARIPVIDGGPVEQQDLITCALDLTYATAAPRDKLMERARATLAQATAFTAAKGFFEMPDAPVQIITMPQFAQGNAVAYLDSPGPLENALPAFYAISPVPADWSEEQADSFLAEYNTYMLHELSIHEGVPGHYLQINLANRHGDPLRAVLSNGPFIEGWAVYSERVMAEQGYLDDDPLFRITMLKMRLRSIINTLLDIGVHTGGMSREEAMELMMEGGFQQESEAAGKWTRAQLSSVQLLSYYSGYRGHVALREEARARWGDGFTLRRYHDAVLGHGSPPVRYVRALIFDLPVE
jgi:uncharacterized protein (DUF885 family)